MGVRRRVSCPLDTKPEVVRFIPLSNPTPCTPASSKKKRSPSPPTHPHPSPNTIPHPVPWVAPLLSKGMDTQYTHHRHKWRLGGSHDVPSTGRLSVGADRRKVVLSPISRRRFHRCSAVQRALCERRVENCTMGRGGDEPSEPGGGGGGALLFVDFVTPSGEAGVAVFFCQMCRPQRVA